MYGQFYAYFPQNICYVPQFINFEQFIPTYYPQLPCTYQNQFCLPTQQFIPQPNRIVDSEKGESTTLSKERQDSEDTTSKSLQKKTEKKFSIFKYPKKNAESNVINQIFSYLSLRVKSQPVLQRILGHSQQKIQNFYELLKQIKKKNKKYINRCYIRELSLFENDHSGFKLLEEQMSKGSKKGLSIEEFRKALRILISYYLRSKCISTVITSRKLDKQTMKEHLHRKRQVQQYLTTQMEIARDTKAQ